MLKTILALVTAIAVHGVASAQLMQATVTGKVTLVHYDTFFSAKTDDLFTAVFTYDPTKGTQSFYQTIEAVANGYQPNAPVVSVAITVNGKTDNWELNPGGSYLSQLGKANYGAASTFQLSWQGSNQYYQNGSPTVNGDYMQGGFNAWVTGSKSVAFDAPFSGAVTSGRAGFLRQVQNPGRGYDLAYNWEGSPTSMSAVSAVPEVTAWAMLIFGFGMIGSAMRLRRRRALNPLRG